jgi:thiol-disulfide isomerase/thioredoxin
MIMLRLYYLTFLLYLLVFTSFAQSDNLSPLILQGTIKNSPQRELVVFIENIPGEHLLDTIRLEEDGSFYFETNKVTTPQLTSLQKPGVYINDIFIAPGYNLTISCDAKDPKTANETLKISGKGAKSNIFRNTLLYPGNDPVYYETHEFSAKALLAYIDQTKLIQDSLYHELYQNKLDKIEIETHHKEKPEDPYFAHFAKLVKLDNQFTRLNMLLAHVRRNNYSYEKAVRFVRDNFNHQILNNISQEEWLISDIYQRTITYYYQRCLLYLDKKKDKSLEVNLDYILEMVSQAYKGTVRDYALTDMMNSSLEFSKSLDKLMSYKKKFEPYVQSLKDSFYQELIARKFAEKEAYLLANQTGKPAPSFTLTDHEGKKHRLEDFIGKVVLLDFWASWCKPCREETPYLKEIHEQYEDDIALISIAVRDFPDKWIKAIEKDSMQWLQLLDKEGKVDKAYHTNAIPRYIIIDKQGNIAHFDAPRPSDTENLKRLLNEELTRKE